VCGEIRAMRASSPAGSTRPSASAIRIVARDRSLISAAAEAISGSMPNAMRIMAPRDHAQQVWHRRRFDAQRNVAVVERQDGGGVLNAAFIAVAGSPRTWPPSCWSQTSLRTHRRGRSDHSQRGGDGASRGQEGRGMNTDNESYAHPSPEQRQAIEQIYQAWDAALASKDVDAALALYAPEATLENPLIPPLLGVEQGICRGHAELRPFISLVFQRPPAV